MSWPTVSLDRCIANMRAGVSLSGESRKPRDGEVGILTLSSVANGRFAPDKCKAVPADALASLSKPVKAGTLLMSRSNTIDLVGSTALVEKDFPDRFLPDLLWEITLREDSPVDAGFLADYLATTQGRTLLQSAAMGTSGSMKKLSMSRVRALEVPEVPAHLQWAWDRIRRVLNAQADLLTRQLSAKRALKDTLMEELLTGRRRFPAFGEGISNTDAPPKDWSATTLGKIAGIVVSNVDKHSKPDERAVRLCNYMDVWTRPYITSDLPFMRATAAPLEIARFGLRVNDVLLTKDSETREEIAEPSVVLSASDDMVLGYHVALVRPDATHTDGQFLAAQLRLPLFRQHFVRAAQGATRFGLTLDTLRGAPVWLPSLAEQQQVAAVDFALHREIILLESMQRARENQKRALMRRILSGELTVPVAQWREPVHA